MSAKDIILKPISRQDADRLVKEHHYSGKIVPNSQIHIGVFYAGKLEGVMQYGPSMDKRKTMTLVSDSSWSGFLELNRMAFSPALPKNSESRAIAMSMKILKKHLPNLEWIISYADATQCGDGTIYRASGFVLTGIKENRTLLELPNGEIVADISLNTSNKKTGKNASYWKKNGAKPLVGFQLRYIYFLDKEARARLTVPELPFDEIAKRGATMYRGERLDSVISNTSSFHEETGGVNPTSRLHLKGAESDPSL